MVSPIRSGSVAALTVGTYAGRLLIDLHYDPDSLANPQAEKFVDPIIKQLDLHEAKSSRS